MSKTIRVSTVLEKANLMLAAKDNEWTGKDWRRGVSALLEAILYETDNYHGYYYPNLRPEERTSEEKEEIFAQEHRCYIPPRS